MKEFDWLKWAGLSESERDKLLDEAKKVKVQVFESDSEKEIFNRILAVKTYYSNTRLLIANLIFTAVSCSAAVVSVLSSCQ